MENEQDVRDVRDGNEQEESASSSEKDQQGDEKEGEASKDDENPSSEGELSKGENVQQDNLEKPQPRPVYTMPVSKHQAEKRKWQEKEREYQKQLDELKKFSSEQRTGSERNISATSDELKQYAEEKGLTLEAAEALFEIAERKIQEKIKPLEQHFRESEILSHKRKVEEDFNNNIVPLIQKDFPNADSRFVDSVKKTISDLAFSERYNQYPLEDIYAVRRGDFHYQSKHSIESSGGAGKRDSVDYSKVTDSDIENMSPSEYKQFSDYMAKRESRYYSGD